MSQALLETRNKFTMSNPKANQAFTQDSFFKWSEDNFYRTSTNDMSAEVIILNLNGIPSQQFISKINYPRCKPHLLTIEICSCPSVKSLLSSLATLGTSPVSPSTPTLAERSLSRPAKFSTKVWTPQPITSPLPVLMPARFQRQMSSCTRPQDVSEQRQW